MAAPAKEGSSLADLWARARRWPCLGRIERGARRSPTICEAADWLLPARTETALAEMGLAGIELDRAAASLSGGEATRAALAGLLICEPDMILLDEPTNNLDADGPGLLGG